MTIHLIYLNVKFTDMHLSVALHSHLHYIYSDVLKNQHCLYKPAKKREMEEDKTYLF